MAYVSGASSKSGCVFCDALAANDDPTHLVLLRSRHAYLILNAFPYASGHLMAVFNRHIAELQAAQMDELEDVMALIQKATVALAAEYRPDGFNIGLNQGSAAGAGIKHHLHMHVVPRWSGDSNFMAVVGDVRVMPETLGTTYERLRAHLT